MLLFRSHLAKLLGAFVLLATLSACQTISSSALTAQTQSQLDRIDIAAPNTRLEQIFNRALTDNLNQMPALRDLQLDTALTASRSSTLALRGKSSNLSKTSMSLTYSVTDKMSGEMLTSGNITATATSGTISSYYGQDKSQQFAEERLTATLADKLSLRLRRFFLANEGDSNQ